MNIEHNRTMNKQSQIIFWNEGNRIEKNKRKLINLASF